MIKKTSLSRAVAVTVLGTAITVTAPLSVAHAEIPPPPVPIYVGDFPTKEQCIEEAEIKKNARPLYGYTCASNGNPAGLNSSSYSLYEHRSS